MTFRERWLTTLAVGYIFMYFSEFLFWANHTPSGETLLMWLVYSLAAYIFLSVLALYRVRNLYALFLAGAVYGWLLEGVIVQTMYAVFPFQIAFTGLSWHALLDVLVGWYLIRKTLFENNARKLAVLLIIVGGMRGIWAVSWWVEDKTLPSVGQFAVFSLWSTLATIPAYWGMNRPFQPHKIELRILVGMAVLLFILVVVLIPFAVLILPPLLWLIFRALRRHRESAAPPQIDLIFPGRIRRIDYALLLLLPLTATGVFAVLYDLLFATIAVFAIITVPISVILFVRSLIRLGRESPA